MLREAASHGHMNDARWRAASRRTACSAAGPDPAGSRSATSKSKARFRAQAPSVCTVCKRGARRQDSQGDRLGESGGEGAGQCAATHLDHHIVQLGACRLETRAHLVADRLATFDCQAVLVALARKRQGPSRKRPLERYDRGVPRYAWLSSTDVHIDPQCAEARHNSRVGVDWNERVQPAASRRRHDSRGQRRVATARNRKARSRRCARKAEPFDHLQVKEQSEQVTGLVRAGNVACLVLHPERHREPETFP